MAFDDCSHHHWACNGGAGQYGRGVGALLHHFAAILLNGLRDYGIEPQVWGGVKTCVCSHECSYTEHDENMRDLSGACASLQGTSSERADLSRAADVLKELRDEASS